MSEITKTKTVYPVSLQTAKTHLRVDTTSVDDDNYITNLIKTATRAAENYIGKDICLTSSVLSLYGFNGDVITMDESNIVSIDNVISDTSTLLTVSSTRKYQNTTEILLSDYVSSSTDYAPLKVEFTSGYEEDECPEDIAQAILIKISNLYDLNREDYSPNFLSNKNASDRLLDSYKIQMWF